jgi:Na+-driven multidrug efflux pump/anti-sigma regulatory factor (Ser/Thr protein kinase)
MNTQEANAKMVTRLLFHLLPVQVLLAAVGAVNGIVSSFFASNYVGIDAMSAVGLYAPLNMLITAISTILIGGSVILCGKYLGQNQQEKMQNVFSLDLMVTTLIGIAFIILFIVFAVFDLTGFITRDAAVRPLFNRYLLGQAIGVIPLMFGNSFASFLSLENMKRRTLVATVAYIIVNVLLNFLFVKMLHMEAFGLALASSLGLWVFFGIQAAYFLSGRSHLRFSRRGLAWGESRDIVRIGLPGAASYMYQTARGLIVNWLLEIFVGSVGVSAFAAANNLMAIFWSLPTGMLAVSRILISVSVGEEDRQTLTDVMRVMFRRFLPLMAVICAMIIACAIPLTRIFFQDPAEPVYLMTAWGFRILPLCMPFSIICMHFTCYGQASDKQGLVHLLALLDGVVCVAGFTALLIPGIGMNSVYIANVLNGVATTLAVLLYALIKNKRLPRNMEELMVIPASFGVPAEARMDLSVRSVEDVVSVARRVQRFCLDRGIPARSAYLAGLSMEEMAGNVMEHGFTKDRKSHTADLRVVHKDRDVILRIKDDCVPFDPKDRNRITEGDDPTKNIGIRMIYRIMNDITYENLLGLNVLTIII